MTIVRAFYLALHFQLMKIKPQYTVTSADADGDAITYSISGSEILIDSSSGVLTFESEPDYETKSSYTTTVTASDGTYQLIKHHCNINNLNDNSPFFTSSTSFNTEENIKTVTTVTATDKDGDTIIHR